MFSYDPLTPMVPTITTTSTTTVTPTETSTILVPSVPTDTTTTSNMSASNVTPGGHLPDSWYHSTWMQIATYSITVYSIVSFFLLFALWRSGFIDLKLNLLRVHRRQPRSPALVAVSRPRRTWGMGRRESWSMRRGRGQVRNETFQHRPSIYASD
ncbi:hypothetical protein K431DRAFT_282134 [Polychaeton citri CBS 116435]|uniref:Uncharacterized protein n=1 Tax=Polychaeton citri CBS 116435 TaxID=1314669 RepID=A0A9P4UTN3_9PEZI|nr:hypothetical protein K431DRAFT_282134 [Polychaeton citri CBS 116435]